MCTLYIFNFIAKLWNENNIQIRTEFLFIKIPSDKRVYELK